MTKMELEVRGFTPDLVLDQNLKQEQGLMFSRDCTLGNMPALMSKLADDSLSDNTLISVFVSPDLLVGLHIFEPTYSKKLGLMGGPFSFDSLEAQNLLEEAASAPLKTLDDYCDFSLANKSVLMPDGKVI